MTFQPLPSTFDIVKRTWELYAKKWNELVAISAWLIYFGIVNFGLAFLIHFLPNVGAFLAIPLQIVMGLLTVWTIIRLMQAALNIEAGKKNLLSAEDAQNSWSFFWPLIITGLLQILIILGASLLLIIPGIYLAIALAYSPMLIIDKGLKGMEAIKASYRLVKGRWWSVWWRETASGFIFGLGLIIIVGFIQSLIGMIALGPTANLASPDLNASPMFQATMDLFGSITEAASLPLFIILRAVILRTLQKTSTEQASESAS